MRKIGGGRLKDSRYALAVGPAGHFVQCIHEDHGGTLTEAGFDVFGRQFPPPFAPQSGKIVNEPGG